MQKIGQTGLRTFDGIHTVGTFKYLFDGLEDDDAGIIATGLNSGVTSVSDRLVFISAGVAASFMGGSITRIVTTCMGGSITRIVTTCMDGGITGISRSGTRHDQFQDIRKKLNARIVTIGMGSSITRIVIIGVGSSITRIVIIGEGSRASTAERARISGGVVFTRIIIIGVGSSIARIGSRIPVTLLLEGIARIIIIGVGSSIARIITIGVDCSIARIITKEFENFQNKLNSAVFRAHFSGETDNTGIIAKAVSCGVTGVIGGAVNGRVTLIGKLTVLITTRIARHGAIAGITANGVSGTITRIISLGMVVRIARIVPSGVNDGITGIRI
jgi:hypothetical protein